MKRPLTPVPWDMVVFLTITTTGFVFSVQKMRYPMSAVRETASLVNVAALEEEPTVVAPAVNESQMIDLGCLERKLARDHVSAPDKTVRLKGKFCHLSRRAMRAFDGMKVKNLTNGYEGTVFFHGTDSAFVSDELVLQSGKNLIQVEWRESHNSVARNYVTEVFQK